MKRDKMGEIGSLCFYNTNRRYYTKVRIVAIATIGFRRDYTVTVVAKRDKTYLAGQTFQTTANWLYKTKRA